MTALPTDSPRPASLAPSSAQPALRPRGQRWALAAIRWYQRLVDGRPSPCRFFPTCSSYALEAFEVYGSRRGLWLTARRLLRCRPLGPSGYDPVPVVDHRPADDRPCADGGGPRADPCIRPHPDVPYRDGPHADVPHRDVPHPDVKDC